MRTRLFFFVTLWTVLLGNTVLAQDTRTEQAHAAALDGGGGSSALVGEADGTSQADLELQFEQMFDYVRDVRFDESDIRKLMELGNEYQRMADRLDLEAAPEPGKVMEQFAVNRDYVNWTRKHGLDQELWWRKVMRIQMFLGLEEVVDQWQESDLGESYAALEKMREHLTEEQYQQALAAIRQSEGFMETMKEATENRPRPTAAEEALLIEYKEALSGLR